MKNKWSQITILEYAQIIDILQNGIESLDKVAAIISILTGLELSEVMLLDLKVFQELANQLDFLHTTPTSKLQESYVIGGQLFAVNYKMNSISTQQYIDMLTLSGQPIKENMHKILSLFLIPAAENPKIGKKNAKVAQITGFWGKKLILERYGSYNVQEVADLLLNHLTIDIANELMVFFCKVYEISMSHTQVYLAKMIKQLLKMKMPQELKDKLIYISKDGDGLQILTKLQKELEEAGIKYGN